MTTPQVACGVCRTIADFADRICEPGHRTDSQYSGYYTVLAMQLNVARYQFSGDGLRLPRFPN
jgi:hypothetical protein